MPPQSRIGVPGGSFAWHTPDPGVMSKACQRQGRAKNEAYAPIGAHARLFLMMLGLPCPSCRRTSG